jgi:hypothetical protein
MPDEAMTPSDANAELSEAERFLAATVSDEWLSIPELVECLSRADYWQPEYVITAAARETHVHRQLATLRDEAGELLFASLDVYSNNTLTMVYKQARQLRRSAR